MPRKGAYQAARPLWQVAPSRDAEGEAVADFMLLVPRLRERGPAFAEQAAQAVRRVCEQFAGRVHFADLNLRTGAIWISVDATPGLCREVASAIRLRLPEAVTVGGQMGPLRGELTAVSACGQRVNWLSRIRQRVARRLLPSQRDSGTR